LYKFPSETAGAVSDAEALMGDADPDHWSSTGGTRRA